VALSRGVAAGLGSWREGQFFNFADARPGRCRGEVAVERAASEIASCIRVQLPSDWLSVSRRAPVQAIISLASRFLRIT
jgi:hypothetical protein